MASPCWACSIHNKYDNCNGCVLSAIFSSLSPEDLRACIDRVGTADDLKVTLMGMSETARTTWVKNVLIETQKRDFFSKLGSLMKRSLELVPSFKPRYPKAPSAEVIPRDTSIKDTGRLGSLIGSLERIFGYPKAPSAEVIPRDTSIKDTGRVGSLMKWSMEELSRSLRARYSKAPSAEVIPHDTSIMDTTWIDNSVVINIPDDSVESIFGESSGERYHESSGNRESSGSGSGTEYLPSHFVSIPK